MEYPSSAATGSAEIAEGTVTIAQEGPTLLLNNLPCNCSTEDIDKFIRRKFGSYDEHITELYIPEDGQRLCSTGEAIMKLRSLADLRFTVEKLHMVPFKGRAITATVYPGDYESAKQELDRIASNSANEPQVAGSAADSPALVSISGRKVPGEQKTKKTKKASEKCSGKKSSGSSTIVSSNALPRKRG